MAVLTTRQKRRINRLSRAADIGDYMSQLDSDGSYTGSVTGAQSNTTAVAFETYYGTAKPSLAIGGQAGGNGDYTQFLRPAATLTTGDAEITIPDTASAAAVVVLEDIAQTLTLKELTAPTLTDPVIASDEWASAQHDHGSAAGGGALSAINASLGTTGAYFEVDADSSTGTFRLTNTSGAGGDYTVILQTTVPTANRTLTLPDATDTLVGKATTDVLTNKTHTDPTINGTIATTGLTMPAFTLSGAVACASQAMTAVNIDSGAIDGAIIGANSAAAGSFAALAATTAAFSDEVTVAAGKDITFADGDSELILGGTTSGEFHLIAADTGSNTTTLINGNATGGACTITLPATSGTLIHTAAANIFTAVQTVAYSASETNVVYDALVLSHETDGTPAAGLGAGVSFKITDLTGATPAEQASIDAVMATVTGGAEDCDMNFNVALAGTVTQAMQIDSDGQKVVIGRDTTDANGINGIKIYPLTTSYGSFNLVAGDDTGDNITTLTTGVSAGAATLTLPVVTGTLAALNGTNTWSGVNTYSAEPIVSISDGAGQQAAVTDVLSLRHVNTGSPAAGIGVGVSFECTTADAVAEQGSIDLVHTDVSSGAEEADLVFSLVTAGTVREAFRMDADGGFVIGNSAGTSDASKVTAYPTTTGKGSLVLSAVDNDAADVVTTIQNGQAALTTVITLPSATSTLAILGANSFTGAQTFGAGILASGSVDNDFSGGTGAFKTSTGTNTIGGTVSLAADKNVACVAGTTAIDWSLGTGTFDTTTGTNTMNGDVEVAANKDISALTGTGSFDFSSASGTFKTTTGTTTVGGPLDVSAVAAATLADGDSLLFLDATDSDLTKQETLANLATLLAGTATSTGLSATNSVLSIDAGSLTAHSGVVAPAADKLLLSDAGVDKSITYQLFMDGVADLTADAVATGSTFLMLNSSVAKTETIDDIATFMAGTTSASGLTATAGVLAVDAGSLTGFTGAIAKDADKLLISDAGTDLSLTYQSLMDGIDDLTAIGAAPASTDSVLLDDGGVAKKCTVANLAAAYPRKVTFMVPGTFLLAGDYYTGGLAGLDETLDITATEMGAAFCKSYNHDNTKFANLNVTGAQGEWNVNYQLFPDVEVENDACYFGALTPFCELWFDMSVTVATYNGAAASQIWEYSQGSSAWATLTLASDSTDVGGAAVGQQPFGSDGCITFVPPADWDTDTVDGQATTYWIRCRCTAAVDITQIPLTNDKEHHVVTPTDGCVIPFACNISAVRATDGIVGQMHTTADVQFVLFNFTKGTYSLELVWPQDKRTDRWTTTALKAASAGVDCDADPERIR